jgi:hypothetical protein
MPASYISMGYQVDRREAAKLAALNAPSSSPTADAAAAAKEPHKSKKQQQLASDTASVSSFGSTVALFKGKFSRKDKDKKQAKEAMSEQVSVAG